MIIPDSGSARPEKLRPLDVSSLALLCLEGCASGREHRGHDQCEPCVSHHGSSLQRETVCGSRTSESRRGALFQARSRQLRSSPQSDTVPPVRLAEEVCKTVALRRPVADAAIEQVAYPPG